jgi:hypothetical protein
LKAGRFSERDGAARLEQALQKGPIRFLLLLAYAMILYGRAIGYGFSYDDADLLHARHETWLTRPWSFEQYYRPLQALLFSPHVVGGHASLLHLENLVVGTLIVFLFGRYLQRIGFTSRLAFVVELACVSLPTSMMLMVWISQRTDWPVLLLGLAILRLSFSAMTTAARLATFVFLGGVALLSKETAVAVLALAPLFALAWERRRGLALALGVGAALVFAGYLYLRMRVLPLHPVVPITLGGVADVGIGILEALIYPSIQVCFTYDPRILALNLSFFAMAIAGVVSMLRTSRRAAVGLLAVLAAYTLAVARLAEPRNLVIPGFVTAAFAVYFVGRLLGSSRRTLGLVALAVFFVNVGVLAGLSISSSYALRESVMALNARLETGGIPRGYVHEIDVNTRFRTELREALGAWYRRLRSRPPRP